jgi:ribosomal protein L37E
MKTNVHKGLSVPILDPSMHRSRVTYLVLFLIISSHVSFRFNSNDNDCSLFLGAVVSKTPKCGVHTYNTTKDICCSGIFIENGHLLNLECCGIKAYHKRNETCDEIIKNKTRYVTLLRCIDGSRMGTERPLWTFVFIYKNLLATFQFINYLSIHTVQLNLLEISMR